MTSDSMFKSMSDFSGKHRRLLSVVQRCGYQRLNASLNSEVQNIFRSLVPLSSSVRIVPGEGVGIGKNGWFVRAPQVKGAPVYLDILEPEFLSFIRLWGDDIADIVDEDLKAPFARLVKLASGLRHFVNSEQTKMLFDPPIRLKIINVRSPIGHVQMDAADIGEAVLDPIDPYTLCLHTAGTPGAVWVDLRTVETMYIAEQLYSQLMKLYGGVARANAPVIAKNARLLGRMRKVVAPYVVVQRASGPA